MQTTNRQRWIVDVIFVFYFYYFAFAICRYHHFRRHITKMALQHLNNLSSFHCIHFHIQPPELKPISKGITIKIFLCIFLVSDKFSTCICSLDNLHTWITIFAQLQLKGFSAFSLSCTNYAYAFVLCTISTHE